MLFTYLLIDPMMLFYNKFYRPFSSAGLNCLEIDIMTYPVSYLTSSHQAWHMVETQPRFVTLTHKWKLWQNKQHFEIKSLLYFQPGTVEAVFILHSSVFLCSLNYILTFGITLYLSKQCISFFVKGIGSGSVKISLPYINVLAT